jgi:hypothetical protein
MSTLSVFTPEYPLLPWAGDGLGWAGGGLESSVASSQPKRPLSYDLDVGIRRRLRAKVNGVSVRTYEILEALEPQFKKTLRGNLSFPWTFSRSLPQSTASRVTKN